jgi:C-terminal processing protease CtpA/Prc
MRFFRMAPLLLAAGALAHPAGAQRQTVVRATPLANTIALRATPRAVIGISTSSASSSRDTLGLLVSSVRADSPAEKAGILEGNRIAAINGVSLKLSPADVGDDEMADVMSRRLSRELDRIKPGDEIELRVYTDGQTKTVRVQTMSPEDLYQTPERRRALDRPTLGISLAMTGSSRDTLGVFVLSVEDGGPAAKAGIEEGSRIASINGVDVRGRRADTADDDIVIMRSRGTDRLTREIERLKPGDDVDLRVFYNGQYRNVKAKVARFGDLPHRNRAVMITSDGPGFGGMGAMSMSIDAARVGDEMRRAMDEARLATDRAMVGVGRGFGAGFGRAFGRTMSW